MFGAIRTDPFLNDVAEWPLSAGWALFFQLTYARRRASMLSNSMSFFARIHQAYVVPRMKPTPTLSPKSVWAKWKSTFTNQAQTGALNEATSGPTVSAPNIARLGQFRVGVNRQQLAA
jgi:hypothetical protein